MQNEPKVLRERKKRPKTAQPYGLKPQINKGLYSSYNNRKKRNLRSKSAQIYADKELRKMLTDKSSGFESSKRKSIRRKLDDDKTLVISAINTRFKKDLKRNVPLYKENFMGHVFYEESSSRIIRPTSSKPFYKPGKTIVDRNRKFTFMKTRRDIKRSKKKIIKNYLKEAKKDNEFFLKNPHFFRKSSASIMRNNPARDRRLNFHLDNYLQASDPLKKAFKYNSRNRKKFGFNKQAYISSNSNSRIPFIAKRSISKKRSTMFSPNSKKKKPTVEDLESLKQMRSYGFSYVEDHGLITQANLDMD